MLGPWRGCAALAVLGFAVLSLESVTPSAAAPVIEMRGAAIAAATPPAAAIQLPFTPPDDVEGGARRKLWLCVAAIGAALAAGLVNPAIAVVAAASAATLCS